MIFGSSPFFCWFSVPLEFNYGIELSCGNREPATEYDRSGR